MSELEELRELIERLRVGKLKKLPRDDKLIELIKKNKEKEEMLRTPSYKDWLWETKGITWEDEMERVVEIIFKI